MLDSSPSSGDAPGDPAGGHRRRRPDGVAASVDQFGKLDDRKARCSACSPRQIMNLNGRGEPEVHRTDRERPQDRRTGRQRGSRAEWALRLSTYPRCMGRQAPQRSTGSWTRSGTGCSTCPLPALYTKHDPLLFHMLYLTPPNDEHTFISPETGRDIHLSQFHIDACQRALGWRGNLGFAQHRHFDVAPRGAGKSTLHFKANRSGLAHGHRRFMFACAVQRHPGRPAPAQPAKPIHRQRTATAGLSRALHAAQVHRQRVPRESAR